MLFGAWGLLTLEAWPTLFDTALIYLGKLCFLDCVVWPWHDMRDATEEYRLWTVTSDA